MRSRIAYLGPQGTYSEEAARRYASRQGFISPEWLLCRSIVEVLEEVAGGNADIGVVPAENSIEGSVAVTLDYLAHETTLPIIGEVVIPIRVCLLVHPQAELEKIAVVYSHPQPLAQCRRHLRQLLPQAEQKAVGSTAEAARLVAGGGDKREAALGNQSAAGIYGLEVAVSDMQDVTGNATRFLVVGRTPAAPSGYDKTSIVFGFQNDRPGNLYRALGVFAERHINLTKLESRPAKRSLGDYLFFVDMEGHITDEIVKSALSALEKVCDHLKILGSYPRADKPPSLESSY